MSSFLYSIVSIYKMWYNYLDYGGYMELEFINIYEGFKKRIDDLWRLL